MKKLITLTLALILALTLAANNGGNSETNNPPSALKTKSEVEALLPNFIISLTTESSSQKPYHFYQATSDKGTYAYYTGDHSSYEFYDFTNKMMYDLNPESKTGEAEPFEYPDEMYKGFWFMTAQYLFIHEGREDFMVKTGNEKIIGRDATVYTVEDGSTLNGVKLVQKYWIDDEYGFTLKYTQSGNDIMMYVTEFTVGGVSVEGMINLNEYEIK